MGAEEDTTTPFANSNINNYYKNEKENEGPITAKELLTNPDSKTPIWKRLAIVVVALLVDTGLPLAFYFILRLVMDPVWAMLVSGIPALIICIVKAVWKKELSVMALIIFFGFVITAVATIITDDARILLLEKSLMLGVVGFLHLISLIPFRLYSIKINRQNCYKEIITIKREGKMKPFIYYNLAQMYPLGNMNPLYTDGEEISKYTWLWNHIRVFKVHMYVLTGVTGFLLSVEFVVKGFMIFSSMSIDDVMIYSNIFFYILLAIMFAFDGIYIFLAKKNFYFHVDNWIAQNYVAKQTMTKEKREGEDASSSNQPSFLLFSSSSSVNGYDPLLKV